MIVMEMENISTLCVACGWGLTTRGGPKEVGTSTTGAVVMILILLALMDVVLTQVLFGA